MNDHLVRVSRADLARLRLTDDDRANPRADGVHPMDHMAMYCSDYWFQEFIKEWLAANFPDGADAIVTPGSPVEFCVNSAMRTYMVGRVRLLHRLHLPGHLWVAFHNYCGSTMHHRGHLDPDRERAEQLQDLYFIEQLLGVEGLLGDLQLHSGTLLTRGPAWVPLGQLVAQARELQAIGAVAGPIESLERDFAANGWISDGDRKIRPIPV